MKRHPQSFFIFFLEYEQYAKAEKNLPDDNNDNSSNAAAKSCNAAMTLVAQLGRALAYNEIENKKASLGGDLDPRPLPYQGNALPG